MVELEKQIAKIISLLPVKLISNQQMQNIIKHSIGVMIKIQRGRRDVDESSYESLKNYFFYGEKLKN